jgi:hypothetical protein
MYSWALQKYKDIAKVSPKVIVTDREKALMNSIEKFTHQLKIFFAFGTSTRT